MGAGCASMKGFRRGIPVAAEHGAHADARSGTHEASENGPCRLVRRARRARVQVVWMIGVCASGQPIAARRARRQAPSGE